MHGFDAKVVVENWMWTKKNKEIRIKENKDFKIFCFFYLIIGPI